MAGERRRLTFISYSRINQEFALKLAKELKSEGFSVWLDQLDIPTGARWDDEIEKALRSCGIFLAVLTPAFVASENAKDEIGYAIDHGKRILPVLLQECEIPLRMRRFQYVDFTRLNYKEGIRQAKALLSKLVKEESIPTSSRSPKDLTSEAAVSARGRERPTQPSGSKSTPRKEVVITAPKKASWKKPGVVFAGIALFIALLFMGRGLWAGGLSLFAEPSPTNTATKEIRPTATHTPTEIPNTPTPAIPQFFSEEFDQGDFWETNWAREMRHGDGDKSAFSIENGEAKWDLNDEYLWVYYLYQPYTYTDVRLDVEFKNLTGPSGSYLSLVCGYSENGWYEFNLYGGQYDIIRRDADRHELSRRSGGLSGYKFARDVINRVTVICSSNALSISANDADLHFVQLSASDNLGEGQAGIALLSGKSWPVSVQITSIKISAPWVD